MSRKISVYPLKCGSEANELVKPLASRASLRFGAIGLDKLNLVFALYGSGDKLANPVDGFFGRKT